MTITTNIKISTGNNIRSNKVENKTFSYDELVEYLKNFKPVEDKYMQDFYCAGHFEDNIRITENLKSRTLIVFDIDKFIGNTEELEKAIDDAYNEYQYIAYSSFSHRLENPRLRVILFPSREIDIKDFRGVSTFLATKVQSPIDDCSYKPANAFFKGGYPKGSSYTPFFKENMGKLIDIDMVLENSKPIKSDVSSLKFSNERSICDESFKFPIGLTHDEVIKYLSYYKPDNNDYDSWIKTGIAIHHETLGSITGRIIWRDWSKTHFKKDSSGKLYTDLDYDRDTKEKWNTFAKKPSDSLTFKFIKSEIDKKYFNKVNKIPTTNSNSSASESLDYSCFVDLSPRNKPMVTIDNIKILLDAYNIEVKCNVISKQYIFESSIFPRNINDDAKFIHIQSLANKNGFGTRIAEYVTAIADENKYNPIVEFIESKTWDGISRLQDFYDTIPSDSTIKELLMRKWLLSAVACAYLDDDFTCKGVLVFQGKQSTGKTSWFRKLLPNNLREYILEGVSLDPTNKDSVIRVIRNWICELGEIDCTFSKTHISALKAFITSSRDSLRLPYAKSDSNFSRKTVFIGSVEDKRYLVDNQNLRFWTIPIRDDEKINIFHTIDMQQLYAEVAEMYKNGESWHLTENESKSLEIFNNEYKQLNLQDEILYRIEHFHDFEKPHSEKKLTSQVYNDINNDNSLPNGSSTTLNNTSKVLDQLKIKKSGKYWLLPPLKNTNDFFS